MPVLLAALLLGTTKPPPADEDDDRPRRARSVMATPPTAAPSTPMEPGSPAHDDNEDHAKAALTTATRTGPDGDDGDGDGAAQQQQSPIVVTAHRLDVARANVEPDFGASTYTLTNDAIENRPGGETTNLGRILLQVPGVSQSGSGAITVRGSRTGLQYRVNNVIIPQGVADFGERLSSRLAERTELITGALPAQYGLQVGGVVNITTKSGAYAHGGQAELFGGGHGALEPAFEYGGSSGATSYFASGSVPRSNVGLSSVDGSAHPRHDRTSQVEGFFYGDHVLNPQSRVSLIIGSSNERFEIPGLPGVSNTAPLTGMKRESNQYAIASYLHSSGSATIQASLFGLLSGNKVAPDQADSLRYEGVSRSIDQHRISVGAQVEGRLELNDANILRGGVLASVDRERGDASAVYANGTALRGHAVERRMSTSAFLEDELKATSELTFNAGVRLDQVSKTGDGVRLSPRASVVWAGAGGTKAHVGYARYYVPAPLETEDLLSDGSRVRGETDDYVDAGVEQKLGELTIGIDAYSRSAHNLIQERELGASRIVTSYNLGRARLRGIELTSTYSAGSLSLWANLAVAKGTGRRIGSDKADFTAAQLAYLGPQEVPLDLDQRLTASGGASYRLGRLRLSGDILYGSGTRRTAPGGSPNGARLPAHAQVDLAAVYHATGLWRRPADLRLDVTNLLDRRYALCDGTALGGGAPEWGPRRGVFVGIEQSF
jgi:outer membrane cobalamin receptor